MQVKYIATKSDNYPVLVYFGIFGQKNLATLSNKVRQLTPFHILPQHHFLLPRHVYDAALEPLGVHHRVLELQIPGRQRHQSGTNVTKTPLL
jgi:hypothetical protein